MVFMPEMPRKPNGPHPGPRKGMTREEAMAILRARVEADKQAKREATRQAAKAIEEAMKAKQVPGKAIAESEIAKLPEKEKIAEPGRRTPRGGADERHKKKRKMELKMHEQPGLLTAWLNTDIFSRTGSSLLNTQLQDKLGAGKIAQLLHAITQRTGKRLLAS